MGGDGSLKPWIDQINSRRGKLESKPKLQLQEPHQGQQCCAPKVQRIRDPIKTRLQVSAKRALFLNIHGVSLRHPAEYSLILKTIPRMHSVLDLVDMLKYGDYLKLYGIDFNKFKKLTWKDLEYLGIINREDLAKLLKAVEMAVLI